MYLLHKQLMMFSYQLDIGDFYSLLLSYHRLTEDLRLAEAPRSPRHFLQSLAWCRHRPLHEKNLRQQSDRKIPHVSEEMNLCSCHPLVDQVV